jgi:hypothetical protein
MYLRNFCGRRCFRCAKTWQRPEQMLRAVGLPPRRAKSRAVQDLFAEGDHLLADQNAEEADERDDGWGWRPDAYQAVDQPDKKAGAKR